MKKLILAVLTSALCLSAGSAWAEQKQEYVPYDVPELSGTAAENMYNSMSGPVESYDTPGTFSGTYEVFAKGNERYICSWIPQARIKYTCTPKHHWINIQE